MSEPIVEALELPYGTIVGDGATVHADGSDANPHPDVSAFEGVRVTFTPSDGNGRRVNTVIWTGPDGPTILHPQVEVGRFVDGRLVLDVPTPPQPDGMRLMATVSDDMVPNSWGWKMEWTGWPGGAAPGRVIFPLTPGATVDIAEALAGYLPEVPAVEFANLLAAADEVLQARDEVQQISGLTGEDEAVAFLVGSSSNTRTALESVPLTASDDSVAALVAGSTATRAALAEVPTPATDPSVAALVEAASATRAALVGLKPTIDVRDYGAVGDGVADDTAALQAAAAAAQGGILHLIAGGNHRITDTITIAAEVIGNGATIQTDTHVNALALESGASVDGVRFMGAGYSIAVNGRAITITGADPANRAEGIRVSNCTFRNFGYYAIYGIHAADVTITRCASTDVGYAHFMFLSSRGVLVDDCRISGALGAGGNSYGIAFTRDSASTDLNTHPRSEDCTARNCVVENIPWEGLDTHAGRNILFSGNTIRNCGTGIALVGAAGLLGPIDCKVIGNTVYGTGTGPGVTVVGYGSGLGDWTSGPASGCVVQGNVIVGCGDAATDNGGLNLYYTLGLTVGQNIIERCINAGISLYHTNHGFTVSGNTVIDAHSTATARGLFIRSTHNTGSVMGNTFIRSNTALNTNVMGQGIRLSSQSNSVTLGANSFAGGIPVLQSGISSASTDYLTMGVGSKLFFIDGPPEGVVAAPVGSLCLNRLGSAGTTFYVKETGAAGSTGWVGK